MYEITLVFRDAFVNWSVCLSVIGCRIVAAGNLVDDVGVRRGGGVFLVFVSRSRKLVPLESVILCRGKLGFS